MRLQPHTKTFNHRLGQPHPFRAQFSTTFRGASCLKIWLGPILVGDEADQYGNSTYNIRSWSYNQSTTGADELYGGAGNDSLVGGGGDDVLDGGTGKDTMTGGAGIDVFVLRAGDGGSAIEDTDIITDFTDGTDVLELTGLAYADLLISQGDGSVLPSTSTVIRSVAGEYLAVLQNTSSADINYLDFVGSSTVSQTIIGSASDDVLIGTMGNDVITSGGGSDNILGWGGDDVVTVSKVSSPISTFSDGGSGADTINIDIGVDLKDMVVTYSGGYQTGGTYQFTSSAGDNISFKNFDALSVNSKIYQIINDINPNWGARGDLLDGAYSLTSVLNHAAVSEEAENIAILFTNSSGTQFSNYSLKGLHADLTKPLHIYGSEAVDYIVIGGRWIGSMGGSQYSAYYVEAGAGNDQIDATTSTVDSIYAGTGNDIVFVDVENLTRNIIVDGGAGVDTLAFSLGGIGTAGVFNLTLGTATGFENIYGTAGADTITGDEKANELRGGGGADTLHGLEGDDIWT